MQRGWQGKNGGPVLGLKLTDTGECPQWSQKANPSRRKVALLLIQDYRRTIDWLHEEMDTIQTERAIAADVERRRKDYEQFGRENARIDRVSSCSESVSKRQKQSPT